LELRRGLLQGSALSPILFNIYINDLIEMINQNTNIGYGYADDIIIICEDRTETIKIINKIEIWSKENTMDLNKNKCGILNIRKTKDKNARKEIKNIPIVKEYKYLGIIFDEKLNLDRHLEELNTKLTTRAKTLKKQTWRYGIETKIIIWNSLITSILSYSKIVEKARGKYKWKKLESLYKKTCKIVLGLPVNMNGDKVLELLHI
jgi:hypothetical protein